MTALEAVMQLGTWGQQHPQAILSGVIGLPLLLGGASLRIRLYEDDERQKQQERDHGMSV